MESCIWHRDLILITVGAWFTIGSIDPKKRHCIKMDVSSAFRKPFETYKTVAQCSGTGSQERHGGRVIGQNWTTARHDIMTVNRRGRLSLLILHTTWGMRHMVQVMACDRIAAQKKKKGCYGYNIVWVSIFITTPSINANAAHGQ